MALTFEFSNHAPIQIYLGTDFYEDLSLARSLSPTLVCIQAHGHELEHIQTRFANLPYSHRLCTWHGEMARFILDNLNG